MKYIYSISSLASITVSVFRLIDFISNNQSLSIRELIYSHKLKYIFITLIFSVSITDTSAQDTLYLRGEKNPQIVNITIVKKNSLNYSKENGGLIHIVKMKDVNKIKFFKPKIKISEEVTSHQKIDSSFIKMEDYPEFKEFRSTISVNSIGIWRNYTGLNYLHYIKSLQSKSGHRHFFANLGGGFYKRTLLPSLGTPEFNDRAEGYYLEVGMHMEIRNKRKPKNRLHIGLELNNRWVEKTITSFIEPIHEVSDVVEFAVQIPIGYTFRSPQRFYFNTGVEVTTEKLFPALHVGIGLAFGK